MNQRARLVVFDMAVAQRSPAGSCVLAEVLGLAATYQITVFSEKFDRPEGSDIEWVRIPLPRGPLFLRYWLLQLLAFLQFHLWRLKGNKADIIQSTQGQFVGAEIVYAHFCHRAYLQDAWLRSPVKGLRRAARWVNHRFNAFFEALAFKRAKVIVVPSLGLKNELIATYPAVSSIVRVVPNPVNVESFCRPDDFDQTAWRKQLQIDEKATVFAFMALGDFARKGLGLVIAALGSLDPEQKQRAKVVVVGGQPSEIAQFQQEAEQAGVAGLLCFVGLQNDVRPYLWLSNAFVFPSLYETFSLVIFQAAAAGLPSIMTKGLYGAEDLVQDGKNGWQIERSEQSVREAMANVLTSPDRLLPMAEMAKESVKAYSVNNFVAHWQSLFVEIIDVKTASQHQG